MALHTCQLEAGRAHRSPALGCIIDYSVGRIDAELLGASSEAFVAAVPLAHMIEPLSGDVVTLA